MLVETGSCQALTTSIRTLTTDSPVLRARVANSFPSTDSAARVQGVWLRDYTPVEERQGSDSEFGGETLGRVRPSNAYQRRIAGTNWT